MRTKLSLVFDVREDGTKVWAAECQGCGSMIVGERNPPVTVISMTPDSLPLSPTEFSQVKDTARVAWENARKNGVPIFIGDSRFTVASVPDNGDMQRALEAHAESCPRAKPKG